MVVRYLPYVWLPVPTGTYGYGTYRTYRTVRYRVLRFLKSYGTFKIKAKELLYYNNWVIFNIKNFLQFIIYYLTLDSALYFIFLQALQRPD